MVPGQAFVLRFDGVRLAVSGGCNNMTGSWRLSPQGQLMVGRLAATMKACEPALMQADAALSAVLAQHLDVQLQPGTTPSLRLVSPTRQTLVLNGQPTLESLYGAPTRIFLEVARADGALPARRRCAGAMPAGARAPLRQAGAAHRTAGRMARLLRPYRRLHPHARACATCCASTATSASQVPADASRYVYVLDMVVESETVKQ